jgi:hypothetical protein
MKAGKIRLSCVEEAMRGWSRGLRDVVVRVLAGAGLVLALAVLGTVLVSTAVHGDEKGDSSVALRPGGGFGDGAGKVARSSEESELAGHATDPSRLGVLLGVVVLTGGVSVLGWGARRPSKAPAPNDAALIRA